MSKVTVKKGLIIFHNPERDWTLVRKRLVEEYGPSIVITYAMRERLGFSSRYHTAWLSDGKNNYPEEQIHLDFYSESALTWFQLKYL